MRFNRKSKCKCLAFIPKKFPQLVALGQKQTESKDSALRKQIFKWEIIANYKEIPSAYLQVCSTGFHL